MVPDTFNFCDALPCTLLTDFVESYWYVEAGRQETSPRPDAILPNGTFNLIFNLSGFPHREYASAKFDRFEMLKTRWFSGIRNSALVVGPTVCTKVIGIRFRPAGLVPFMDTPPSELAETTIDPDLIWGKECEHIHEQLFELSSVNRQFRLLEQWLLTLFDPVKVHIGLLSSLNLLQESSGDVAITQLARLADLSPRQYRRRCEEAVGMPPKRLAKILRFKKLIQKIGTADHQTHWAGLAFACGYYDQAHLIADFREFADVTPGEYLRRKPLVPGFLPVDTPMSFFSNTITVSTDTIRSS